MITIVQSPLKYTPAGNPIILQIESSLSNILYFKIQVSESESDSLIASGNVYTTPDYVNGSYVNLSKILSNAVKWEINNSINIPSFAIEKAIIKYKVTLTEWGLVSGILQEIGDPFEVPGDHFTWEAEFDRISFHNYNISTYLVSNGLPANFLTQKPNYSVVNDYSSEQLYFLHESQSDLRLIVKTFNSANTLIDTYSHSITGLGDSSLIRLQVSPKALSDSMLVNFADVSYYTIYLENATSIRKSEIRYYNYKSLACNVEPVNILWVNSLGGIDSYQFQNVQETINISRNTYKKNLFKLDNGFYSDRTAEVLNPSEEIINVNQTGTYTATSAIISDSESIWLSGLFTSKQVYVELADYSLVPVIVTNPNYQIQRQKYNRGSFNTVQVTYTLNGDVIPMDAISISQGFGSGSGQVEFIDQQMNYDTGFDTILTFEASILDDGEDVNGTVAAINNNLKFEFNKIVPRLGLTSNMSIKMSSTLIMVIDFLSDYLGKPFRFTDSSGGQHLGTFVNGTVTF
jgi:hypothetical protein